MFLTLSLWKFLVPFCCIDGEGGGEGIEDALNTLDGQGSGDSNGGSGDGSDQNKQDGKERRGAERVDRRVAPEDPEFDFDDKDDQGQPIKKKLKLSELRSGYMKDADYRKKTQEISETKQRYIEVDKFLDGVNSHEGLRKLIHGIAIKSGMDSGKINDVEVNRFLNMLDGKKEEVGEEEKEILATLDELDPDSAQYKILKRELERNKSLQQKLGALETKIEGVEKFNKGLTEKEENVTSGLIIGPEDCWQFSVFIFICTQILRSADNDIKSFMNRWDR